MECSKIPIYKRLTKFLKHAGKIFRGPYLGQCFSLAAPMCQVDFRGQIPTTPTSPVSVFPLLHPCASRFTGSSPHKSYH